jgi:hypothetical protein
MRADCEDSRAPIKQKDVCKFCKFSEKCARRKDAAASRIQGFEMCVYCDFSRVFPHNKCLVKATILLDLLFARGRIVSDSIPIHGTLLFAANVNSSPDHPLGRVEVPNRL